MSLLDNIQTGRENKQACIMIYACCGDWKHMTYWLAAATLTATVTF